MVSDLRILFLDARDDTLIARFSETRRKHPLGDECSTLGEAIAREREALALIAELGQRIDTSDMSANTLRNWVKGFMDLEAGSQITVLFESFGFKHGIPLMPIWFSTSDACPIPTMTWCFAPLPARTAP
jgi:UPF0042 nucleotide-binding protein